MADGRKAGRMAFVQGVRREQRLVLYTDLVEEARVDLQHRVSHGRELGTLEELQDRPISHHPHPVSRENGAAQRSQQLQQSRVPDRGTLSRVRKAVDLCEQNIGLELVMQCIFVDVYPRPWCENKMTK